MKTKKITTIAMFAAVSLIIFIIEAQIPPVVPIPGVKLGLANIVTMLMLTWYGPKDAFAVLMLRIFLGSIFAGQAMSLLYSLAGGILCFAVTAVCIKAFGSGRMWLIGIIGAAAHNFGQVAAAVALTSVWQITAYIPVLVISAAATGALTGLTAGYIVTNRAIVNAVAAGRDDK